MSLSHRKKEDTLIDVERVIEGLEKTPVPSPEKFKNTAAQLKTFRNNLKTRKNANGIACLLRDLVFEQKIFPDEVTIALIISRFGSMERLDYAQQFFNFAKTKNIKHTWIYGAMIEAAGENNRPFLVNDIFAEARAEKMTDALTYRFKIEADARCGRMDLAEKTYKESPIDIKNREYIDGAMGVAAGKCGNMDLVKTIYTCCKENNRIKSNIYNSIAIAAYENKAFDFMLSVLTEARKNKQLDQAACNIYLNFLVENNNLDAAEALFNENIMLYPEKKESYLDLHDYDYGSAFIKIYTFLQNQSRNGEIVVDTGKGLHSQHSENGLHPVRRAVFDAIKLFNETFQQNCKLEQDRSNLGWLKLSYIPAQREEKEVKLELVSTTSKTSSVTVLNALQDAKLDSQPKQSMVQQQPPKPKKKRKHHKKKKVIAAESRSSCERIMTFFAVPFKYVAQKTSDIREKWQFKR